MCNCVSNARPNLGGTVPLVLMKGESAPNGKGIDACIAPLIQELWDNDIITLNSCCGHNGVMGNPSVVLHEYQASEAKKILGSRMEVFYWKLTEMDK